MGAERVKSYLGFGLVAGLAAGWALALWGSDEIGDLAANIVLCLKGLAILIPVVSLGVQGFDLFQGDRKAPDSSLLLWVQPLGWGLAVFVGTLALFLVPVLLVLMVVAGVDGALLRQQVYQEMNWTLGSIGLLVTILSFYLISLKHWIRPIG